MRILNRGFFRRLGQIQIGWATHVQAIAGVRMTTVQAVILGMMLAWVPSLLLVAFLHRRDRRVYAMKPRNPSGRIIAFRSNKPLRGNLKLQVSPYQGSARAANS